MPRLRSSDRPCAEVIAPAAERYDSGIVLGYYLDVAETNWMRVWAAP